MAQDVIELTIEGLGWRGDGVARYDGRVVHVRGALPGERVAVALSGGHGRLLGVLSPSPARRQPACAHAGHCGGCSAQHMDAALYRRWKAGNLVAALVRAGIEIEPGPLLDVGLGARRRASLEFWRDGGSIAFGYHGDRSGSLVAVRECPILEPQLWSALGRLGHVLEPLIARRGLRVLVTRADNGIDAELSPHGPRTDDRARIQATQRAAAMPELTRITLNGAILYLRAAPIVRIGRSDVMLPPGAFLQATRGSEAALAALVTAGVSAADRIADLYCGVGTFALRLAERARVLAVESQPAALAALQEAAARTPGLKPVETLRRDLMRDPLAPGELKAFDCVVLDPPHAGAEAQAMQLARSRVPRVVMVSCNPVSLARDLRHLIDGGYALVRVTPVDQFAYSHQLEAVAVLTRNP